MLAQVVMHIICLMACICRSSYLASSTYHVEAILGQEVDNVGEAVERGVRRDVGVAGIRWGYRRGCQIGEHGSVWQCNIRRHGLILQGRLKILGFVGSNIQETT